jgi:hypothetical protein
MRILVSALAICAASFLVGVAGDLSSASARQEQPARPQIVQLPPMTAPAVDLTNAVRAHPLPVRQAVAARSVSRAASVLRFDPAISATELAGDELAGGPDDSSLELPVAKVSPILAAKPSDEKASKA